MAFDAVTAAEIVRKRLNFETSIDVLWAIPETIERLSRKIAANPRKRSLLLTNQSPVTIASGMVTWTDVDALGVLREYLHLGQIWYRDRDGATYDYPLQFIEERFKNVPKTFGNDYYSYYCDASGVRLRNFDINQPDDLEGELLLSVPRRATWTDLDENPELQEQFIEKLIETLLGVRNDSADDGQR